MVQFLVSQLNKTKVGQTKLASKYKISSLPHFLKSNMNTFYLNLPKTLLIINAVIYTYLNKTKYDLQFCRINYTPVTKYKPIKLLRSLDKDEWDRLEAFLLSPYFTTETTSHSICRALRPALASPETPLPDGEILFREIWPDAPFDQKTLTYALSRLNKLTEQFLVVRQLEQQQARQQLTALQLFSERQLDKHLAATQRALQSLLAPTPGQSSETFLLRSDYAELMDQHYIRLKVRKEDHSIQDAADNLDHFYYLRRLHYICSMLDRQNILEVAYDTGISAAWLEHLESSELVKNPMINLYLTIFRSLREEAAEDYFRQLKASLLQLISQQKAANLAEPLLFAINYCARKIRAGQENYLREAIDLYRTGIEAGLLLNGGQLSPWTYGNVVKLCLRLEEYTYAHEFIRQHTSLLPEKHRENAYNFNYAELLYHTNEKALAQEYLNQVAYSDLSYYLGARVLLAKIHYETGAEETLLSLLASFTIFLQRNRQISRSLKRAYLNFCLMFARMLRTPPAKMDQVIQTIQTTQPLTDKEWLLRIAKNL